MAGMCPGVGCVCFCVPSKGTCAGLCWARCGRPLTRLLHTAHWACGCRDHGAPGLRWELWGGPSAPWPSVGLGSFLTQQWLRSGQSDLQCAGQPAPRWAVPGDLSAAAQGSRPRGGLWFFRFSALMCDSGPRSLARSAWPCSGGGAAHWFQYQPVRPDTVHVICTVFH